MFNVIVPMGAGLMLFGYGAYNAYQQRQARLTQQDELRSNLTKLIDATEKPDLISKRDGLINELEAAGNDLQKKQAAWQAIIKPLNPEYYVARDNTAKFNKVQPQVTALAAVVSIAVADLDGKLADNPGLAADVVQFIFKVSNYYSIASTLDDKNFDLCTEWLLKARNFIVANGLQDTLQDAIWHNLMGGHKSREYQMGRNLSRPQEAVTHFEEAVRIHIEKLGSNLDNPNDIELRHVQMCLASTLLQDAMWCVVNDSKISEEVQQSKNTAQSLLDALTNERLVLKDGKPDLYRRAGCLQFQGYALILEDNFDAAQKKITLASETMQQAIGSTGATGQLSVILNDEANAYLTLAVSLPAFEQEYVDLAKERLKESITLSKGQFEQMYAENAETMLQQIDSDYKECFYSKLAASVRNPAKNSPALKPSMM